MSYADKFNREVEIVDMTEAQELVVKVLMKEGELNFRDAAIAFFDKDIAEYLEEVDGPPNMEWIDGVRYCIKLLREGDFNVNER